MINIDFKLLVFITAARHLNFTKAAREMHISQPAVSKNICDLEMQAGRNLFVRNRHKLSLSEAGRILLDHAMRIRCIYEELNKELVKAKEIMADE
ncbi:MAG TPA: LysR family transcriptional regulator [Niabella sp.]